MSLKVWLLALTLFLIMVISSTVSGADQPGIGDAAYDLGTYYLKQETPVTGIVPFGMIKAAYKNPNPQFFSWYDPFYDDLGWGLAKDSAAFGSALPGAKIPFTLAGGYLTLLQFQNDAIIKWENEHGVTDFWLSVLPHESLDSSSGSLSSSSKLAQHGLGVPQLSPPTSDTSPDASSYGPSSSGIGPLITRQGTSPSQSGTGDITNSVDDSVDINVRGTDP